MCNEKCDRCNKEIEPIASEELCLECGAIVDEATDGFCPECDEPIKDFNELQKELMAN
jgi:NMD protein affecting ribosome stability and mRNA decay